MPHIVDGSLDSFGRYRVTPVSPIVGNAWNAGGCYDGNGKALWATFDNDTHNLNVYRTRGPYSELLHIDNSVDYLTTIHAGYWSRAGVSLNRIGGVVYAVVTGRQLAGVNKGGTYIYRDTSAAANGSGPWVLHGTVNEIALDGNGSTDMGNTANQGAGELLNVDGVWIVSAEAQSNYTGAAGGPTGYLVAHSTNGGVTWTVDIQDFGYASVGIVGGPRNFGYRNGTWYSGDSGNVHGAKSFTSTNGGVTWVNSFVGNLTGGNTYDTNNLMGLLYSTPTFAVRFDPGDGFLYQSFDQLPTPTVPATSSWAPILDPSLGLWPLLFNAGPDARPQWVYTVLGKILSPAPTGAPPCRQYPREDGLATSSATRIFPQPRSQQGGLRRAGGTYY